jgi:hypothetical protein
LFIPDPDPDFLLIPDPGAKKAPDPGSGSATLQYREGKLFLERAAILHFSIRNEANLANTFTPTKLFAF